MVLPADLEQHVIRLRHLLQHVVDHKPVDVFELVINKIRISNKLFKQNNTYHKLWGFTIDRDQPLCFKMADIKGVCPFIEVTGIMKWNGCENLPVEYNMELLIWSRELAYRGEWDALRIKKATDIGDDGDINNKGRVILRIHFDRRVSDACEPEFHLHIGGDAPDNELCWFPKQLELPRIPYPPLDLVLIAELILANFFELDYQEISRKPEWRALVHSSQKAMLMEFINKCKSIIDKDKSLTDWLWGLTNE